MKVKQNRDYAIVTVDVLNINMKEMTQMDNIKTRIKTVLDSHKPGSEKKEYISDEDLTMTYAILSVFTKDSSSAQKSAFDEELQAIVAAEKNHDFSVADEIMADLTAVKKPE